MKYIKKVIINNFQNHDHTEIDLSKGINLIIGTNDAGKSAILRAINFVLHNKPNSKSFIRLGEAESDVSLHFEDGNIVKRIKGQNRNTIEWTNPDGKIQIYDKFGFEIPQEVLEIMGYPPIDEKHGPISYSDQLSNLFLVELGQTELPRSISELTGMNNYEEAIQILNKKKRDTEKDLNTTTIRVDDINEKLKSYDDLEEQFQFVNLCEKLITKTEKTLINIQKIQNYIEKRTWIKSSGEKIEKSIIKCNNILQYQESVEKTNTIWKQINNMQFIINNDVGLLRKSESIEKKIKQQNIIIKTIDPEKINIYKQNIKNHTQAKKILKDYTDINTKGQNINQKIKTQEDEIVSLETQLQTIIIEIQKSGNWCEVCKRPIPLKNLKDCKHD